MDYNEAIEFVLGLPDMERSSHGMKARTMSLEAMIALLARLGNPQLGRKTAHVTGSKGKGSTSVFLTSMLSSAAQTSLYTSPHLHSYCERICFNLKPVSVEEFASGVDEIKGPVLAEHQGALGPISTFGAMTSLFFVLSKRHKMQWQVVEVGLGGLYDGTNVFEEKELVIITAISLEHTNILGKTTLEIARNKAGIIRPGAKVVVAPQKDPAVAQLIKEICISQNATFVDVEKDYKIEPGDFSELTQSFSLSSKNHGKRNLRLSMLGLHQLDNAATAIAAIDALNETEVTVDAKSMSSALEQVRVPGRIEFLQKDPTVVIDGAHNGESAAALVAALRRHFPSLKYTFVVGANSDKNIVQILESLKPFCENLIATRSVSEKAMDPKVIWQAARDLGIKCEICNTSIEATELALEQADSKSLICGTGSLYLIAEMREYFMSKKPVWSLT